MPRPWALVGVGCSSGEEPYSLAMCAAQAFARAGTGRFFGVTGTDISLHALQRARQANYPARKLSNWRPDWSNAIANARPTAASA